MRSFRDLLTARGAALGTFCTLGSVDAVELACDAGLDFVIVDGQHGSWDAAGLVTALRAIDSTGCYPIVRLPANGLGPVEGLLDAGYPAMLAPMVNTAAQAATLVQACCYPPLGQRSQSSCRASMRGGASYRESFNAEFTLIVMIEHIAGVEAIAEILAVPGVAAVFVGPTDLASSLAAEGDADDADDRLAAAVERVRAACAAAGTPLGIAARDVAQAAAYARRGFSFMALATDRRLLGTALSSVAGQWQTTRP